MTRNFDLRRKTIERNFEKQGRKMSSKMSLMTACEEPHLLVVLVIDLVDEIRRISDRRFERIRDE